MRRLIRNAATGWYFSGGEWTADWRKAQEFPDLQAIMILMAASRLDNAEVVLQPGPEPSERYDVRLGLGGAGAIT
jgi:hypothetical protein